MLKIILKHYLVDVAIGAFLDNLITGFKSTKPSLGFELPSVGDSILLATKDGCSDIVEVMLVGDTWLRVEIDDIDSDEYGQGYVIQLYDIDYIVNFGNGETPMSDDELISAIKRDCR
jgi:hypothetical protein